MLLMAFMLLASGALAVYFYRGLNTSRPGPATAPAPDGQLDHRSADEAVSDMGDPLTAAAVLTAIVATEDGWPEVHARVEAALAGFTDGDRARHAIEFAQWVLSEGVDADRAVANLCRALSQQLEAPERAEVAAMVRDAGRAGGAEGERLAAKALERLPVS